MILGGAQVQGLPSLQPQTHRSEQWHAFGIGIVSGGLLKETGGVGCPDVRSRSSQPEVAASRSDG